MQRAAQMRIGEGAATPRSRESGAAEPRTHSRTRARARVFHVYARTPGAREGVVSYERSVISMHQFD